MLQKVNGKLMLTDSFYSFGKKLVQVYIPAVSTLYFTLGNIWRFPAIENVVGSFAAIATFLGVCLGLSSKQYDASEAAFDGKLVVGISPESGRKLYSLEVEGDPEDIEQKSSVSFKVTPHS